MPRPGSKVEKPKNFSEAMKRLLKSLKPWKVLLNLSLVLAMFSAILSLITPNKLSDFADTIAQGLQPDTEKLEIISTKTFDNFKEENMQEKMITILTSSEISKEDVKKTTEILSNTNNEKSEENYKLFMEMPDSVMLKLLNDIEVDNIVISSKDELEFIKLMKNFDKEDQKKMLKTFDKLPKNIYELVKPSIDMKKIKKLAVILITLLVLSSLFGFIQNYSMSTVSNRFAEHLRNNIGVKINKLPLKYFDKHETGDILSRITNDVDTIAQTLNMSLGSLVSNITLFLGSIIMMFVTNWIMAITAILSSLFGFIFMGKILSKSQKYFVKRQQNLGDLNGYIEEMYTGHKVVKAYNGTKDAKEEFEKLNEKLYDSNRKSQFLSGLMPPFMMFIGNFGYVAVCIVGALLVINNNITFGVIVAFMIYVRMFTNPMSQIAQSMTNMQSSAAASERVFEFLDEEEMSDQKNIKNKLTRDEVKGKIEFKNVKFGYDKNKIIIKDFSAKANPGDKIAIVGPTGAGKTTMVNLLMKFYEINDGDIIIDNTSVKNLTRENIHNLFIMVLQDTWLFEGTIRDNIKYNKKNISDEEIWNALKVVGIDHFVKSLPGGLDYVVSNNDSISAGQKQLLTIARGMIEDAPFLILDEATSNVDTRTEELVQKAMDKLMKGRTSFIIAHRLSTIKNADNILVMNEGDIIETGTHEELIKRKGFYADLYNSQFKKM